MEVVVVCFVAVQQILELPDTQMKYQLINELLDS